MKFRNKIITAASIAAALAIMLAAALGMGIDRAPQPDVLAQPPLENPQLTEDIIVYANNLDSTSVYHVSPDCRYLFKSKMREMPEREAVALGLNPCGLCISLSCPGHDGEEIEFVYYAQGAKYFHKQEECSGGKMPLKAAYADLITEFPEKEPCPMCLPEGIVLCLHGRAFLIEPAPDPTEAPQPEEAEEYVPVLTKDENTSPKSSAEVFGVYTNVSYKDDVFYNTNGTYYHSNEHCQGMMNAEMHSRKDARSDGKFPCPLCLNVYSTKAGKYFHLLPDCIGMMGAELRSLEETYPLGQTRCPVCLSPETVYCTPKGAYFHAVQDCSGMEGAQPIDPEDAWNMDKDPCPVCITGRAHAMLSQQENGSTLSQHEVSASSGSTQSLAALHEQLFQTAFGFLPEAKAQGYWFEEFSTEPYCWHLTDGENWPVNSNLYTPGEDYDGYRVHLYSGAQPAVIRQIMEQVAVTPMMSMYSLAVQGLKNHVINQERSFSESDIDIQNILVSFDDAQRICGASIDFLYNQKIVSVVFTPESKDYRSWNADVAVNAL